VGFIAVDWSGAARHEHRHLWLAEASPEGGLSTLRPLSREGAVDHILDAAVRDPDLVVGLDFAFSMPAWWLAAIGVHEAPALWADAARLEKWLAGCPAPFWGRPGRRRPIDLTAQQQWRRAELALRPRPKSVFQLGGAGAVGTGSLRGMPALHRLRGAGFAIWPFDPPSRPMAVELWPRLFTGPVVKSDRNARRQWLADRNPALTPAQRADAEFSEDAFDAAVAALGGLVAMDSPAAAVADPTVRLEGWIWTVPLDADPGRPFFPRSARMGP
jgi:hypothetical protein